eukprot:Unigene8368_Nuclearia_a/m.25628 Unigene8368_Nuclearia_a/g.25628  ORF Unigene8368_Nuclearia_a/g.25628 Unigene8368_Nuclearia_a/m.25628 type:complete len:321 (+) Unigene8368_Nuclearia_a:1-963(+)
MLPYLMREQQRTSAHLGLGGQVAVGRERGRRVGQAGAAGKTVHLQVQGRRGGRGRGDAAEGHQLQLRPDQAHARGAVDRDEHERQERVRREHGQDGRELAQDEQRAQPGQVVDVALRDLDPRDVVQVPGAQQHVHDPQHRLDRQLLHAKEQREQRKLAHGRQHDVRLSNVFGVAHREQRERDEHVQDRLLVHVPPKDEARERAVDQLQHKVVLGRVAPERDKRRQDGQERDHKRGLRRNVRQERKLDVTHDPTRNRRGRVVRRRRPRQARALCDKQHSAVDKRVQRPEVGRPVRVQQAALEREQPPEQLRQRARDGERPE